jgi:ribosomal protein L12E/L44/L45/RPP1/RPP2
MRLGKLQASGYVADVAGDDISDEVTEQTAAPASAVAAGPAGPQPVGPEREQVIVSG